MRIVTTQGLSELKRLFTERYDALKSQLMRRLGSAELASDALHDAYLRLAGREGLDRVRAMQAYILHTALNTAVDRIRGAPRELADTEVDALFEMADPAAGPPELLEDRNALRRAVEAMSALPPRQRDIFYSARMERATLEELATRWGISVRLVSRELQRAHEACVRYMEGEAAPPDAPPAGRAGQRPRGRAVGGDTKK